MSFKSMVRSVSFAGVLLAAVASSPAAAANQEPLDCRSYPGSRICGEMRVLNSLLVNCSGAACYSLFQQQLDSMDALTRLYYRAVTFAPVVETRMGQMAETLARRLCAQRYTGEPSWIQALTIAANRTVEVLGEIQGGSGIRSPYTCRFNVR